MKKLLWTCIETLIYFFSAGLFFKFTVLSLHSWIPKVPTITFKDALGITAGSIMIVYFAKKLLQATKSE